MVEVEPVTEEHLPTAVSALASAFGDDPLFVWLLPDPARRARSLRWLQRTGLELGQREGLAIQAGDGSAAAVWFPPGRLPSTMSMIRSGFLTAPFRLGLRPFARFMRVNALMERAHKRLAPGPHWYLMFIGVDPAQQGHGLGSALVRFGLARADEAGVPCYLETSSERNLVFYERLGFSVVETASIGEGMLTGWAMRREARPA